MFDFLGNFSVRNKLFSLILLTLGLICGIAIYVIVSYNTLFEEFHKSTYQESYKGIQLILNADRDLYQAYSNLQNIIIPGQKEDVVKANQDAYMENINQVRERVGQAEKIFASRKEKWETYRDAEVRKTLFENLDDFNAKFNGWAEIGNKVAGSRKVSPGWDESFNTARGSLDKATECIDSTTQKITAAIFADIKSQSIRTGVGVGVIIIFIFIIGLTIARNISLPLAKTVEMIQDLGNGMLGRRLNLQRKDEIGILAKTMDDFAKNLQQNVVGSLHRIANGDVDFEVTITHPNDEIGPSLRKSVLTLRQLVAETRQISNAAIQGKLDERANATNFEGAYREIIDGINGTLDSVIEPLNYASKYIEKMANGDELDVVNNNFRGYYNILMHNLDSVRTSLNSLIEETAVLTTAAKAGQLEIRCDISKHRGSYANLVKGINDTLDAVIEPVKEAANVLQEMSEGNLNIKVMGDYKGDHARIKDSLNNTIRTIADYVNEISAVLRELAQGNLDVEISGEYLGNFTEIKKSTNLITKALNSAFADINLAAEQVASGSRQIADGSQGLSHGSTEQSASIEEITATIEQIAAQTKQTAMNANQANELATTAKVNALQGNEEMKEMLRAMDEINDSSANISKIIKVIDEIAFQTNILALNAAVEAARAGQYGKGFAVVAEEVRNLAGRSANAAKETTTMIEGTITKVGIGTKIARDTADALIRIVNGVTQAANLVSDIDIASNEQASGIAQVNQAITQVAQVTQMNTATAEESAAASEELSSQAEMLRNMVGQFRLKRGTSELDIRSELTPEMIKMIQEMIARKDIVAKNSDKVASTLSQVAATASKVKISLDDGEFGKY